MRVALFAETFLPKIDGIVTVTCLLLDHLAERGIESMIVAPSINRKLGQPPSTYANTDVVRVRGVTWPLYPELKIGPPTYSTYKELKSFDPDVAHFIGPAVIGSIGMGMMKHMGVPTLASFHLDLAGVAQYMRGMGVFSPVLNWWTKLLFNAADFSLAPSTAMQQKMKNMGINNVGLWKRGVDGERFNPAFADEKTRHTLSGGHPGDNILVYVGRLSAEKKLENLRQVLEQVPNTRLALVGDGPARESLEKHFAGTNTTFMGYITGEPLSQAYASADIFVFPSALETFGLVVTEAMAAGLPVVASRVGGIPDVVEEGQTGYTFDIGDVDTLVEGVRKITTSRERIAEMGQAARAYAETQTWPSMMDEVIDHYQRLIDLNRITEKSK
jgi:glycosyltransferase involved in cell wall biosynthesis